MITFKQNDFYFTLDSPEYELPVFGYNVGELRLIKSYNENDSIPFTKLITYLKNHDIKICTFRGHENLEIIRLLENIGFEFVSTYNIVECYRHEFKEIKNCEPYKISIASIDEYDRILEIERNVHDFSTFSIDPLIDEKIKSYRNMIRVKSHFAKKNHRIYVVKIKDTIAGFLQFVVDIENQKADTLNAAIHPDFQKMNIGKTLFSDSFKTLFSEGCNIITSDYSSQNAGSSKLHKMCNFKIIDQEIHLRYIIG